MAFGGFLHSVFKNPIVRTAALAASAFIPGATPALLAAEGAGLGYVGTGTIKGAVIGGISGYAASALPGTISSLTGGAAETGTLTGGTLAGGGSAVNAASLGAGTVKAASDAGGFFSGSLGTTAASVVSSVSGAADYLGSKLSSVASLASGAMAASTLLAGTPKAQGADTLAPTAPGQDPASLAIAAQKSADEDARLRRGASGNMLTGALGLGGRGGMSAAQMLLG